MFTDSDGRRQCRFSGGALQQDQDDDNGNDILQITQAQFSLHVGSAGTLGSTATSWPTTFFRRDSEPR